MKKCIGYYENYGLASRTIMLNIAMAVKTLCKCRFI